MSQKSKIVGVVVALVAVALIGYFSILNPFTKEPQTQQGVDSTAAHGKLNIDMVCQSALAYMTFTDSVSADVFIAECKEGKHPEVIERYKAEMNLGDGAQI